jgi:hypothetical protein
MPNSKQMWKYVASSAFTLVSCSALAGRTIHKKPSPEGTPFQTGIDGWPTCERCLEEDESATHILCDCEVVAYLRFRHLGQFFMEPSDYYNTTIRKPYISFEV